MLRSQREDENEKLYSSGGRELSAVDIMLTGLFPVHISVM